MNKKSLLAVLIILISFSFSYAEKSRFYSGEKVIDTMYINSNEGLKVRDNPDLKSKRLCGVPHGLPVKIVAIGDEATIDGITDPWVQILIPRYEWGSDNPEYGWVFGGYLSKNKPDFHAPETKEQLEFYLITRLNAETKEKFTYRKGELPLWSRIREGLIYFQNSPNSMWIDEIKVLSGKQFKYVYSEKNSSYDSYKKDITFTITKISENSFETKISDSYEPSCVWECKEGTGGNIYFYSPSLYYINFFSEIDEIVSGSSSVCCQFLGREKNLDKENFIAELIKSGVSAEGTPYEKQYRDYWNPIMEEHQNMASYKYMSIAEINKAYDRALETVGLQSIDGQRIKTRGHVSLINYNSWMGWVQLCFNLDGEGMGGHWKKGFNSCPIPEYARMYSAYEVYFHYNYSGGVDVTIDYIIPLGNTRFAGERYTANDYLSLRSEPSIAATKIDRIEPSQKVTVLEVGNNDIFDGIESCWVKVKTETGKTGWCFGGYLTDGYKH